MCEGEYRAGRVKCGIVGDIGLRGERVEVVGVFFYYFYYSGRFKFLGRFFLFVEFLGWLEEGSFYLYVAVTSRVYRVV